MDEQTFNQQVQDQANAGRRYVAFLAEQHAIALGFDKTGFDMPYMRTMREAGLIK